VILGEIHLSLRAFVETISQSGTTGDCAVYCSVKRYDKKQREEERPGAVLLNIKPVLL